MPTHSILILQSALLHRFNARHGIETYTALPCFSTPLIGGILAERSSNFRCNVQLNSIVFNFLEWKPCTLSQIHILLNLEKLKYNSQQSHLILRYAIQIRNRNRSFMILLRFAICHSCYSTKNGIGNSDSVGCHTYYIRLRNNERTFFSVD